MPRKAQLVIALLVGAALLGAPAGADAAPTTGQRRVGRLRGLLRRARVSTTRLVRRARVSAARLVRRARDATPRLRERAKSGLRRIGERLRAGGKQARALLAGTFVDGPRHSWHAIKSKPGKFAAMVAATAVIGAGAALLGATAEPLMLTASGAALIYGIVKQRRQIAKAHGVARTRLVGSVVLWPTLLVGASAAAGSQLGHGGASSEVAAGGVAAATATRALATDIATVGRAAAQSVVIGADAPTVFISGSEPAGN